MQTPEQMTQQNHKPDFAKYEDGLVPVIIQDSISKQVLMLGYVSNDSWQQTLETKVVTFFSRSKQRLWTKGETSGHTLSLVNWHLDCDQDTILLMVRPNGPTCHTGAVSCFGTGLKGHFLYQLEQIVAEKLMTNDPDSSYTARLVQKGIHKVAQKVGEEGVEVVIEAMRDEPDLFLAESADLLYHLIVLLKAKGQSLAAVDQVLISRHN
jgi:phosphoribosyl-ATP pyrophosphohydrolase/phosphoribosyl-AMP cyclohydrolase